MKQFGRYKIKNSLGHGGMAKVYDAYDPLLDRNVALKVIAEHFSVDERFRRLFEHESKIIASLEQAAIVPVYDFGEENGQLYLVMRLMLGGTLANRLRTNGPFSPSEALQLLSPLAPALEMAHNKNIVHRDLKPGNILFDQEGQPYVADFGIAKMIEHTTTLGLSRPGFPIGTPAYMSPEQAKGEEVDERSDIYSLGVILFELLTGQRPYRDTPDKLIDQHIHAPIPSFGTINPDLSVYDLIIAKAMAKNRDERYATVGQMAAALKAVIEAQRQQAGIAKDEGTATALKAAIKAQPQQAGISEDEGTAAARKEEKTSDGFRVSIIELIRFIYNKIYKLIHKKYKSLFDAPIPAVTSASSDSLVALDSSAIANSLPSDPENNKKLGPVVIEPATPNSESSSDIDHSNENLPQVTLISSPPKTRLADQTIISVRTSSLKVFKEKSYLIEALIEGHLKRIRAKLDKREGTRLFLTGFGSFGGTSLVQATTAKLMENFKNNQAGKGKVLVIRFDTSHHTRWGQYQLFINESKVGSISQSVDQKQLLTKIHQILAQRARSNNTPSTNYDFFQGVTGAFAQDPTSSQAVTTLVSQVLKLLDAQHNDTQMSHALDQLLATPSTNQVGQVVLIIDRLEREDAMQRLLNSAISNGPRYPRLSLIVVTPHQAFNRWPQPLRKKIRQPHFIEYYYVRRLWSEDLKVEEILKHFMAFDVSVLNEDERHRFDSVFLHLTYQARGSVAKVMRELKMGQYFSKEGSKMVIDINAIYKQGKVEIKHNVRVQQILDRSWVQIIGQGLLNRTATADQAKIGIYEVIEWMRDNHFFDKQELVDAAAKEEIPISNNSRVRKRVLNNLLRVLERNGYLKRGPEADSYELAGLDHPSEEGNEQASQGLPQDATSAGTTVIDSAPPTPQPPTPTPVGPLHVALLGDETTKTDDVTTLATQIGLEVLEAGYRLVMTDRVGVDATVRERLAPYCAVAQVKGPMLIATSQGVKGKQEDVISVSDSHQQLEEFLKKADVLILAQKDGTSDPVFASGVVKERAKKQGVPVIEPFADLDARQRFFVPDVAREMVALAKEACVRV